MKKILKILIFLFFVFQLLTKSVYATTFNLIAPSGELTRGQEVTFTITIDTQGESLTSTIIGLEYDTQYLEFTSAEPGDTFASISSEEAGEGRLLLTGNSDPAFSGSGVFSYVKFKLIAQSPGSTELCALFNPEPTPTPTTPPQPTSTPVPTELPKTGSFTKNKPIIIASLALTLFPIFLLGVSKLYFSRFDIKEDSSSHSKKEK